MARSVSRNPCSVGLRHAPRRPRENPTTPYPPLGNGYGLSVVLAQAFLCCALPADRSYHVPTTPYACLLMKCAKPPNA